jgi:hypothetical protein
VGVEVDQSYPSLISSDTIKTTNIAVGGSSNYTIFMRSVQAVLSGQYDVVVTQWSALNRIWLSPGPGCDFFVNDSKTADFRYRDFYLNSSNRKTFVNTLLLMNHDYKNIFELVDYCCILTAISKLTQTRTIFVNGMVPWKSDIASLITTDLATELSSYTKTILDFDNRDDNEILNLVLQLRQKFSETDQGSWVNLFDSFYSTIVDRGSDNSHPGPKSHQQMAYKISNYLKI